MLSVPFGGLVILLAGEHLCLSAHLTALDSLNYLDFAAICAGTLLAQYCPTHQFARTPGGRL